MKLTKSQLALLRKVWKTKIDVDAPFLSSNGEYWILPGTGWMYGTHFVQPLIDAGYVSIERGEHIGTLLIPGEWTVKP